MATGVHLPGGPVPAAATTAAPSKASRWKPEEDADNPLYKEDNFRMYCLKVLPCSKRYCHDWTTCPFAHSAEKARRRDPRVYNYTGVACPEMKKNLTCPRGDQCPFAHNVFEYWLHHSRYRTQLCNDGVGCKRKICFFAHTLDELRVSSVKVQPPGEGDNINPFAPSPTGNKAGRRSMQGASGTPRMPGAGVGGEGLNMAELQQLGQLHAQLRDAALAAQSPAMMAEHSNDQVALEQLLQLVALAQQQQAQQQQAAQGADPLQQMMALLASQHAAQQQAQAAAQAAAILQAQQQVAALQWLGQMQGQLGGQDMMGGMGADASNGAGFGSGLLDPFPQQESGNSYQGGMWGQGMPSQAPAAQRPPAMPSALTAAMQQQQHVDDLARQLSGLSASSHMGMPLSPLGGHAPLMRAHTAAGDNPSSARSCSTNGAPPHHPGAAAFHRQATAPASALGAAARCALDAPLPGYGANSGMPLASPRPLRSTNSAGSSGGAPAAGGAAPALGAGAALAHHTLHTSPVSVSALGDTFTNTTYFSNQGSSLSSSHDGSDGMGVLHH